MDACGIPLPFLSMIRIAHPEFFFLLLVIPILLAGYYLRARLRRQRILRLGEPRLVEHFMRSFERKTFWWRQAAIVLALVVATCSLAGFEMGTRYEEVTLEGLDMVMALDVSFSMNAEDVQPSRLAKAKRAIHRLLDRLGGDRVALVVFAGGSYIQCPVTTDYAAIRMLLDATDMTSLTSGGSNLGGAMETALSAFPKGEGETQADRVILLFSDGEDHEPDYDDEVDRCRDEKIRVFTVGVGTREGSAIPLLDVNGQARDFKKEDGNVVITRLEDTHLREISEKTEGQFLTLSTGEEEIDELVRAISGLTRTGAKQFQFTAFEDRFQIFLVVSLICLTLEIGMRDRRHD